MFNQVIPDLYFLCTGKSTGKTALTSFDNALLQAGVGNTNLMRMSSILPPFCQAVDSLKIPQGVFLPLAYASLTSDRDGEIISSAVAVAIPDDRSIAGVIMEYSDNCPLERVESKTRGMVEEAMSMREIKNYTVKSMGIEATVEKFTTTFAGIVLWWK